MIAFLVDTWHGWPFLTVIVVLGLIVAVLLLMGMGTIVAILGNKEAHAEYDRQYNENLDWLQRGQPTELEELQQFLNDADPKLQRIVNQQHIT